MQMDVHKTLRHFCTIKKTPYVTATVTKIALHWRSNASFHNVKPRGLPLSAITCETISNHCVVCDYVHTVLFFTTHKNVQKKTTFIVCHIFTDPLCSRSGPSFLVWETCYE